MLILLAQAFPLDGSQLSGWSAAALLGLVLSWLLLRHLPAKDQQIKELLAVKDAQLKEKDDMLMRMVEKFEKALDAVIKHCKEELAEIREGNPRRGR